jgi:hypothetical protein
MHKVKNLYAIWDDGDSHRYFILKEEYNAFIENLERIEEAYDEHREVGVYDEQLGDLLDYFSKGRVEGEFYYVVLEGDLI